MNERGDWEPGEDLFEKLGGISVGGGGGSEEDSSDDDDDDTGNSPRNSGAEGAGKEKKKIGCFYEGPEACREYLGEREKNRKQQ